VLVPSLALLRQFHESWKEQQKTIADYLCVCSEKDIDKGADSNVSHLYEIQAPGRVTTDPEVIRDFLRKTGSRIIYSTYQSSPQIARAIQRHNLSFDLAICDEARKTAGERKHSAFATILDDRKIPCKKRLFMTATPRVVSAIIKNKLGSQTYEYLADMNDVDTYGPEFHKMTFAEAIKKGILVDYKIIAVGITDKELQRHIQERRFVKGATIDEIAGNYALADALRKYKCRHAVSFHSSVKKAQKFMERHGSLYPDTQSFHING
jgi:predicted helicase